MPSRPHRTATGPALALLVGAPFVGALAGCRATPAPLARPLELPTMAVARALAPGGPLAGPGDVAQQGGPDLSCTVRLLYLERRVTGGLAPAEGDSALVADLAGRAPILPVARLTVGARHGTGAAARDWLDAVERGEAGRVVELQRGTFAVPSGASLHLDALGTELVEDPRDWLDEFPDRGPIPRGVRFTLTAAPDGARATVGVDDLDPAREAELTAARREDPGALPGPPPPAITEVVRQELLVLAGVLAPGEPAVLLVGSPFESGEGRAFALVVDDLSTQPDGALLAQARASVEHGRERHAERTAPLSVGDLGGLERVQALRSFRDRGGRPALLFLAQEADARLAQDLALAADEETLAALSREVFGGDVPGGDALGWTLESKAWRLLLTRALEEDVTPVLEAALLRHAGALARFPDVALDALAASADEAAFRARLVEEQTYFLEDSDPSARLRAHDWLLERGAAVPDYAPLAPREERRAALEAWRAQREAAAAGTSAEERP